VRSLFEEHWPTSAALWLRDGKPPPGGGLFANPAYGSTLERLVRAAEAAGADRETQVEGARHAWREGFVASAIDHVARRSGIPVGGRMPAW
jgi:gamma-glutamyltranspeptidase/glutathione hydrolase